MKAPILQQAADWRRCNVDLSIFRCGSPTPEGRCVEFSCNVLTAWRMLEGRVVVNTAKEQFAAQAGEWMFLPMGYRRQEFNADASLVALGFRVDWQDSFRPVFDLSPGLVLQSTMTLDEALDTLLIQLNRSGKDEWYSRGGHRSLEGTLAMDGAFRIWLAAAFQLWRFHLPRLETLRRPDPRVDVARNWLSSQPLNLPLDDIEEIAREVDLSSRHLSRIFLQHYHQTLHGYHEQRRIQYARQALIIPGSRIKSVALELGFQDLSKFSAWFRRHEQVSPRKYRSRLQG